MRWNPVRRSQTHRTPEGSARAGEQTSRTLENLEPRVLMSASLLSGDQPVSLSGGEGAYLASADLSLDSGVGSAFATDFSSVTNKSAGTLIGLDKLGADPKFSFATGAGFSTVVLDTGIDVDHPFFGPDKNKDKVDDRILYQYDFADNDKDASDVNGHGSNVASIIGSQDATWRGIAPAVGLIVLKVFSNSGAGTFGYIEKALQWVVSNAAKYNVSSVNMSLGDMQNWSGSQQLYGISDELGKLAQMNVKVVAAAGNSYGQFGAQGVSYPAADPNVIGVGAVFTGGSGSWGGGGLSATNIAADEITPFSQRSTTMTPIFAPGSPMTGANQKGGLVSMQGTSQATPVISGVAALADQIATKFIGRRLTTGEFRTMINATGVSIVDGDNETDNVPHSGATYKRVDAYALAQAIAGMKGGSGVSAGGGGSTQSPGVNVAPTMTSIKTLTGAGARSAFTISYEGLKAASNASDANGDALTFKVEGVGSGTLTKNGAKVTVGTTLKPGESLVWTPTAKGTFQAFSVSVSDGKLSSGRAVGVNISVGATATARGAAMDFGFMDEDGAPVGAPASGPSLLEAAVVSLAPGGAASRFDAPASLLGVSAVATSITTAQAGPASLVGPGL